MAAIRVAIGKVESSHLCSLQASYWPVTVQYVPHSLLAYTSLDFVFLSYVIIWATLIYMHCLHFNVRTLTACSSF